MNFKKQVLPNGLTLVLAPVKDGPSVTVLVIASAGSNFENKEKNGISHFLEHMCFKGTTRRPKASDISRELDAIGSHYNAFTSNEFTGYFAKAHPGHIGKILDVVSDMYLNPVFDEKEIEKEKGVIVEEINMYRDMPHRHVHDLWSDLLYGDQPAGWDIAGTPETVRAMGRKDFIDYRSRHYVASGTTVVIAGNFEEEMVLGEVNRLFGNISSAKKEEKPQVSEEQTAPRAIFEKKNTDQTHIVMGVRTFDVFDRRMPTLQVLNAILGGGMSSRLFVKLRDELGITYYVRSSHNDFSDYGNLGISAGVDVKRLDVAIRAIKGEWDRLKGKEADPAELEKAKEYLIGTTYLGLDSSDSLAEFYGYQQAVEKRIKTADEIAKEIRAVTAEDVRALANEIFVPEKTNIAAVGRISDEKELLGSLS